MKRAKKIPDQDQDYDEVRTPGDPEPGYCSPGSIEQQLDMCEQGSLRGDQILHNHGIEDENEDKGQPDSIHELDSILNQYYEVDLAEVGREGDEITGDDHSSGLQGGETEIKGQIHLGTGLPGDVGEKIEKIEKLEGEVLENESLLKPPVGAPRPKHLRRLK